MSEEFVYTDLKSSSVDTGGSGGSMNRGPGAPGGPERRATKNLCKKIIAY